MAVVAEQYLGLTLWMTNDLAAVATAPVFQGAPSSAPQERDGIQDQTLSLVELRRLRSLRQLWLYSSFATDSAIRPDAHSMAYQRGSEEEARPYSHRLEV